MWLTHKVQHHTSYIATIREQSMIEQQAIKQNAKSHRFRYFSQWPFSASGGNDFCSVADPYWDLDEDPQIVL